MKIAGMTIAMLVAFLTSGCATALTIDAISPGEEKDESDYVDNVETAWRDEAGNVTLCVTGMPAGGNHWLGSSRNYSIVYPGASPPEPLYELHEAIPNHFVTAADVKGGCSPSMAGMTQIPVQTVYDHEFRDTPYSGRPDRAMATFLKDYAPAPAVYMYRGKIDSGAYSGEFMKMFYARETPIEDDIYVVEIVTADRKREGRPGYVLLLPFAVVFDIVMFPVQLLAVLSAHG